MKEKIILVFKGMILGIANIIPGVSGGTLAISLGIYKKIIKTISHFFKKFKENLVFVGCLGIGMLLSVVLLSKGIAYALEHHTLITKLFFIGLILGGTPLIYKKVKEKFSVSNILVFLLTFGLVLGMTLLRSGEVVVNLTNMNIIEYVILFLVGVIAAGTMIIPGISGSFVLMMLGYYYPILTRINDLTSFNNIFSNLITLGIFGIGVLVGIVLVAKLIEFLLKKYEIKTYYGILGFVLASIPCILIQKPSFVLSPSSVLIGLILCFIGGFISYKLGEK